MLRRLRRSRTLQKKFRKLEKDIEVMKGMCGKLWYAPGMPGTGERRESCQEAMRSLALSQVEQSGGDGKADIYSCSKVGRCGNSRFF